MWIVDLNRQSLDRVVPDQKIKQADASSSPTPAGTWSRPSTARQLPGGFARPGGDALRPHIDAMSNEQYQSLFGLDGAGAARPVPRRRRRRPSNLVADDTTTTSSRPSSQNLGGHDLGVLIDALPACDEVTDRPSVVFAYTVKGWGLPIAGDPLNHAALLPAEQIDDLRAAAGLTPETEWDRFDPTPAPGSSARRAGGELNNRRRCRRGPGCRSRPRTGVAAVGPVHAGDVRPRPDRAWPTSPSVGQRLVTTSPDVSVSTNLGGWINKIGRVLSRRAARLPRRRTACCGGSSRPPGHHIELGISEMNLFLLLHALGLGHELHGQHLLPIGTVYDPFVCRGLDALIYAPLQRRPLRPRRHPVGGHAGPRGRRPPERRSPRRSASSSPA